MTNWQNFQTDVLDILNQYKGYFDFFERVGSLSDNTRPDCFARISREDKKEVWIIDAKNKSEISPEDIKRMENYLETAKTNLIDIGLEHSESKEYEFRPIFITPRKDKPLNDFEQVPQPKLHQFLQKELIYTDTDKIVRDIAKMIERKELNQNQARLLFKSVKPFENKLKSAINDLEKLEETYVGLKLRKNYLRKDDVPTDVSLIHKPRNKIFFLDIPYSMKEIEKSENKIEYIQRIVDDQYEDAFYGVVDTFGAKDNKYVINKDELEYEIRKELGIISKEYILDLFTPPTDISKTYQQGNIKASWSSNSSTVLINTVDDINYQIKLKVPKEIRRKIENHEVNTRTRVFETQNNYLKHEFTVTENSEIKFNDRTYKMSEYTDLIRNMFKNTISKTVKTHR